MSYQRRTLRKLPPEAREMGRQINRLVSVERKFRGLMVRVGSVEFERRAYSQALATLTRPVPAALELEPWLSIEPAPLFPLVYQEVGGKNVLVDGLHRLLAAQAREEAGGGRE